MVDAQDDGYLVRKPEVLDGEEIIMRDAGAAVEDDHGVSGGFEGAEDGVPCCALLVGVGGVEGDESGEDRNGRHVL